MAKKIAPISVQITGNATGLVSAGETAARALRRVEHQAKRTGAAVAGASTAAGAAKPGVNIGAASQRMAAIGGFGRLGAMAGAAGALGPLGLGVAAIGATMFAGFAAANTMRAGLAGVSPLHLQAVEALRQSRKLGGPTLEKQGFTRFSALRAAGGPTPGPMTGKGFAEGLTRGLSGKDSLARAVVDVGPAALGTYLGARLGGEDSKTAITTTASTLGMQDSMRLAIPLIDAWLNWRQMIPMILP